MSTIDGGWRGPSIVKDGLVLYLDAGSPNSYYGGVGTVWKDMSGNGNNGTLTNGPTFNSSNGGNIVFDGVDDYINLGNNQIANITSVNNFTTNLWLNRFNTNGGIGVIHKGPISGFDYDWMVYLGGGANAVQFYKKNTSNAGAASSSALFNLNIITNLSIVLSSDTVNIYINGVLSNTSSLGGNIRTTTNPLKIGRGWDGSLTGRIYQTQIYNRALTAQEVSQNFNATRARFGI
jgi:hypothetical protein